MFIWVMFTDSAVFFLLNGAAAEPIGADA